MKKQLLILFLPLVMAANAHAIIDLRAGYGIQTPAEDNYVGNSVKTLAGFNIDAIVKLPMIPLGLGLRYENMGFDLETKPTAESTFQRISLLVNYRFIDMFLYFGAIGSIGFKNDLEIDVAGAVANYEADFTTTVGAEAGVNLGLLSIGAELGYIMANLKDADNAGSPDFDLNGVYLKALVGVGF